MKLILHSLLLLTIFTGGTSGKNWLRKKFICIVGRGIRTFSCSCWILILCVCARATCFVNGGPLAFHFVHTGAFTKKKQCETADHCNSDSMARKREKLYMQKDLKKHFTEISGSGFLINEHTLNKKRMRQTVRENLRAKCGK